MMKYRLGELVSCKRYFREKRRCKGESRFLEEISVKKSDMGNSEDTVGSSEMVMYRNNQMKFNMCESKRPQT